MLTSPGFALTIVTNYRSPGQSIGTFGAAGAAPSNATGTGNLEAIVQTAARYWESAFADPYVLTINFGWFPRSNYATHRLGSEGGNPHREIIGSIVFDNDLSTRWFLDPDPTTSSEFTLYTEYAADLGGGRLNVGREFTGGRLDAAYVDLYTTAIHEIGHALGLSSANNAFVSEARDGFVDITAPLPYAGTRLPLNSGNAHLNLPHTVLRSSWPAGVRRLASEADILALAEISQFTQINLNPTAIPEPSALALGILALFLLYGTRYRRRTGKMTSTN